MGSLSSHVPTVNPDPVTVNSRRGFLGSLVAVAGFTAVAQPANGCNALRSGPRSPRSLWGVMVDGPRLNVPIAAMVGDEAACTAFAEAWDTRRPMGTLAALVPLGFVAGDLEGVKGYHLLSGTGRNLGEFETLEAALVALGNWRQAVCIAAGARVLARKVGGA